MSPFDESEYCTFVFDDGRKCRALSMPTRHVCIEHWRHDGQFEQDSAALVELAHVSRMLQSRRGVQRALATVFRLIATDRIPPRKASLLLYTGQLLLSSLGAVRGESARSGQAVTAIPGIGVENGDNGHHDDLGRNVSAEVLDLVPREKAKPNGSGSQTGS